MKIVPCSGVIDHFIVDDEDYERVMNKKWSAYKSERNVDGLRFSESIASGISLKVFLFESSLRKRFKRINGNKNDFRKENFIEYTNNSDSQGAKKNKKKQSCSNFACVTLTKNKKRYCSHITFNYKKIHLGVFDTEREAAEAYNIAALHYFGENAKLNIIE